MCVMFSNIKSNKLTRYLVEHFKHSLFFLNTLLAVTMTSLWKGDFPRYDTSLSPLNSATSKSNFVHFEILVKTSKKKFLTSNTLYLKKILFWEILVLVSLVTFTIRQHYIFLVTTCMSGFVNDAQEPDVLRCFHRCLRIYIWIVLNNNYR